MSTNKNFQILVHVRCRGRDDSMTMFAESMEKAIKKMTRFAEFCDECEIEFVVGYIDENTLETVKL